jgi:membrane-associated phospholipid phosphatase/protein-L-isoaspartate O-methyltransferase
MKRDSAGSGERMKAEKTGRDQDQPLSARRLPMLIAGCCLLVLAAAAAGVMRAQLPDPAVSGVDQAWLSGIARTRDAGLTGLLKVISVIGGPVGATIIVAVLCVALLAARRWRTALYIALADAAGSAFSQLIKHIVARRRPTHPLVTADWGSFPSGHVITTLGVGLALTAAFTRRGHRRHALVAVAVATALMMYCRTYLAAHWLSDTIEGVLVGGGLGLILWWAFEPGLADDHGKPIRLGNLADLSSRVLAPEGRRMSENHGHAAYEQYPPHGQQDWDERYRGKPEIWSGNPNAVLVAEVADLQPGTALDVGAGEGGDACWLAERGWTVTAADISIVAIERASKRASERGLAITWLHANLATGPVSATYDLVTAHFVHVPKSEQQPLFRHLAAAVAPGGTLLVVGHDVSDMAKMARPGLAEYGWTTADVAAALSADWTIESAASRPRQAAGPDGDEITIHDAVLRARRGRV